ncbi:MAG: hypothetical protein OXG10_05635 [Candidatus Dadabacteria bacterium]|nr:hypothetical protein [Candidatus Dadabacteria bacterium]
MSGISVVIVANSNNPTILNQDFLYHNGIVPKDWTLEKNMPPVMTPAVSQITFENGFKVIAELNRILFEQFTVPLKEEDIVCADIAKRYLRTVPHVPYTAVGINLHGYRTYQKQASETVSDLLIKKGGWMNFREAAPSFQVKAVYGYEDKTITLDIAENFIKEKDAKEVPAVVFNANIHRDISDETNQQMRVSKLVSILDSCNKDISDFCLLTKEFESRVS